MILEVYTPGFPLNQFVDSFIYHKDYTAVNTVDRFLPDGQVNIVIDMTDYPKFIYDNHNLKEIQACRNVWFSGIRNQFITIPAGRESEMFVINFRKGKAYPFVEMPMNELTDYVVDGELVLTNEILNMRESLLGIAAPAGKFQYAERYLMEHFGHKLIANPFVEYAVNTILSRPTRVSIEALALKVGYSQKHLIKIFDQHVGLTPKAFLRVIRFQKAIADIETARTINWTNVALESGYYDQAHFINDFKSFAGMTPQQYLATRREFLNYLAIA